MVSVSMVFKHPELSGLVLVRSSAHPTNVRYGPEADVQRHSRVWPAFYSGHRRRLARTAAADWSACQVGKTTFLPVKDQPDAIPGFLHELEPALPSRRSFSLAAASERWRCKRWNACGIGHLARQPARTARRRFADVGGAKAEIQPLGSRWSRGRGHPPHASPRSSRRARTRAR